MLYIDKTADAPLYEQIYAHYVREILSGALTAGALLPPTRKLAEELSLSRNTVDRAYQQLMAEGYIQSRRGSGYTVNAILPIEHGAAPAGPAAFSGPAAPPSKRWPLPSGSSRSGPSFDFVYGSMDNAVFPYKHWRQSLNNVLSALELQNTLDYPDRLGEPSLRREICSYLYRSRGVVCTPDQVVVTCGHQYSMEAIANMFQSTGKGFAMEDPGYDGIRAVFLNHGFRMNYVPVEDDGVSLSNLSSLKTDLLYVTPSHQFPTGGVLSIGKRQELLKWAEASDAYLIEDDYDSELRYYTNPIPAMQSLDENQRVIYTGTFSKSLAPLMRLAYIVLPRSLMPRYLDYYHRYNAQVTPLHQLALADFIAGGNYERHINKLRTFYRKKWKALTASIEDAFGRRVRVFGGGAGIHFLMTIDSPLSEEELLKRAETAGIRLYDTNSLYMDRRRQPENQLLLGFPTIPQEAFPDIMQKLRAVWEMDG